MISPAIVAKITVTAVTMIVSWMIRQRDASAGPSLATYCQCMLPVGILRAFASIFAAYFLPARILRTLVVAPGAVAYKSISSRSIIVRMLRKDRGFTVAVVVYH